MKVNSAWWDEVLRDDDSVFNRPEPTDYLEMLLSRMDTGTRVLDAGCGNGRLAYHFLDHDIEYVGIDNSQRAIVWAKEKNPGTTFHHMDLRDMSLPYESFDAIWCCCALNDVQEVELGDIIKGFYRLLRTEGHLMLVLPYMEGCFILQDLVLPFRQAGFTYITHNTNNKSKAWSLLLQKL